MSMKLHSMVLGLFVFGVLQLLGCQPSAQKARGTTKALDKSKPFVFVHRTSGHPCPGEPVVAGVVVAIWENGVIVRAKPGTTLGKAYIKGQLTTDQVSEVKQFVDESGLTLQEPGGEVAVCASFVDLTVCIDGKAQTWAHSPPHTENTKIRDIETFLLALDVKTAKEVDAGPYRAYPYAWRE